MARARQPIRGLVFKRAHGRGDQPRTVSQEQEVTFMRRPSFQRFVRALLGASLLALLIAGSALAHTQTVNPAGSGEGFSDRPISRAWAQAHCNAASPALVGEASDGVVQFKPPTALTCPAVPNPGGQVHGD